MTKTIAALFLILGPATSTAAVHSGGTWEPGHRLSQDEDLDELLALERADADRLRRRGEARRAISQLSRMLKEEETDAAARVLRARARFDLADYKRARDDAETALEHALQSNVAGIGDLRADCARLLAEIRLETGDAGAALATLESIESDFDPATRSRDAWVLGSVLAELGRRDEARGRISHRSASKWRRLAGAFGARAVCAATRKSHRRVAIVGGSGSRCESGRGRRAGNLGEARRGLL